MVFIHNFQEGDDYFQWDILLISHILNSKFSMALHSVTHKHYGSPNFRSELLSLGALDVVIMT